MSAPPAFRVEPVGDRIRRFVADHPITDGTRRFTSREEAQGVPVAEAVLSVPGVLEVVLEENAVTALRSADASWDRLEEQITYAIATALHAAVAPSTAADQNLTDDAMYDVIERIFQRDINPAVASHGGKVELIDVEDGTVVLRMMGGCQGCGMANVTLRQGIEQALHRAVPGLKGIRDITDHASGTNPYFA